MLRYKMKVNLQKALKFKEIAHYKMVRLFEIILSVTRRSGGGGGQGGHGFCRMILMLVGNVEIYIC